MIRLKNMDDRNKVICSGPYTLANRPMIIKPWAADFEFKKDGP